MGEVYVFSLVFLLLSLRISQNLLLLSLKNS